MKFKQFDEIPKKGSKFEFNFKDVQKQNPRLSGKTPFYLYTTNMIEWAKKKGILK